MFAVIKTGGKQYKVAKDAVLRVERLEAETGATIEFDSVLMVGGGNSTTVGSPYVKGALVTAEVVEQARGPKIIVFKKKRRKNYRRKNGHRQDLTVLRVTDILTEGRKPEKVARKPAKEAEATAPAAEVPADQPERKKTRPETVQEPKKKAGKKASKPEVAEESED